MYICAQLDLYATNLDRTVIEHHIGHSEESGNVRAGIQVAALIELLRRELDVRIDPTDFLGQHLIRHGLAQGVDDGIARQRQSAGRVHQTALLQRLARLRRYGRVSTLHDALAPIIGKLANRRLVDVAHAGTGEAQIAGNVEHGLRIVELGRRRGDDVPAEEGASLVLDLVDGVEPADINAVGLIDVTRRIRKSDGDGPEFNQLLGDASGHLTGTDNETTLALQRITTILEHFVGKMNYAKSRCLVVWMLQLQ